MIYALAFASALVLALVWYQQRNLPRNRRGAHIFLGSARGFLLPFFCVALFYSGLQLWVDRQTDGISATTTVRELEDLFERIRLEILAPFELSPWVRLGIVLALVALGVLVPRLEKARLPRAFRIGSEAAGRAYFAVALLGSFTFFGSSLHGTIEARQARINDHIESIGRAYEEVYAQAESLSEELLVNEILSQPSFSKVSQAEEEAWKAAMESRRRLDAALNRQDVARTELEPLASKVRLPSEPDRKKVEEIAQLSRARRTKSFLAARDRGTWSENKATLARSAITKLRNRLGTQENPRLREVLKSMVELVYSQTGEAIIASFLEALGLKSDLLLAELFVDRTLHDPLKDILQEATEKAFTEATQRPGALERLAEEVRARSSDLPFDPNRVESVRSAADHERRSFEEVGSRVAAAVHAADLRSLDPWLEANARLANPELAAAASKLAEVARGDSRASAEMASRLLALAANDSSNSERLKSLLAIEEALGREELSWRLDLAAEEAIATDRTSRWGEYRARIEQNLLLTGEVDVRDAFLHPSSSNSQGFSFPDFQGPAGEAVIQGEISAIVRDWVRWQKRVAALHAVSKNWSRPITPEIWEKAFFRYTQENQRAAVVWAWAVKDFNTPLLEARYGRAIPEYGYSYYVEENRFAGPSEVREIFSEPPVVRLIERYCR